MTREITTMEALNTLGLKIFNRISPVTILLLCVLLYSSTFYLVTALVERNMVFDDSFITFRYAKNLADGYGITWNPSSQPVEGYTNFLLVLILAPFIKLGADPLLVTRVLCFFSSFCICVMFVKISQNHFHTEKRIAVLTALGFLLLTNTGFLSMLGLETVIYTATVLLAFIAGIKYLSTDNPYHAYLFGSSAFVAFLLRPEATLVVAALGVMTIVKWKQTARPISLRNSVKPLAIAFLLPLLITLAWKQVYFGTIIPNPFFLKASSSQIFSPIGIDSILSFVRDNAVLVALAMASFLVAKKNSLRPERTFASMCILIYLSFYAHVDTLMDEGDRFLYPISIFLMYLAIPTILFFLRPLLLTPRPLFLRTLAVLPFFLVLNLSVLAQTVSSFDSLLHNQDAFLSSNSLMQKEYRVAIELKTFPAIKQTRIAFADAGVIAYFTDAFFLDLAGLNDKFIVRETNIKRLTDYFFEQHVDLVLLPADKDNSWITYGHGHLGNYALWTNDQRWDNYSYVGTIKTDGDIYDIHIFLRDDLSDFTEFKSFLQERVADGFYDRFPITIGSYLPSQDTAPMWIDSRSSGN